jgi:hypothetical protein
MSAMCSVAPASVTVSAASGTAFVVSLSNTSSAVVLPFAEAPGIRSSPEAFGLLVLTLMLMLSLWGGMEKKQVLPHIAFRMGLVLCMATCILVCACGGGAGASDECDANDYGHFERGVTHPAREYYRQSLACEAKGYRHSHKSLERGQSTKRVKRSKEEPQYRTAGLRE